MALVAACTDDGETVVEPGILYTQSEMNIDAPTIAQANVMFTVSITTQGGGCVSLHSTVIDQNADGAVITPLTITVE